MSARAPSTSPVVARTDPVRPGRARVFVGAGLAVAGTAYLYAVDPNQPGHYLPCPTYLLTGTYCPGCGGLRAGHALLHGDLGASLGYNPAVLPVLLVLVAWTVRWVLRGRPSVAIDTSGWRFRLVMVAITAFWIARNVPGWDWLSPA